MARWIINRPEQHSNAGEIAVARELRNLSDRWTIRWGFYYQDNKGQTREGDFLILGPHGGLLVLEVKGGKVRHFSSTGNWEDDVARQGDHPLAQLDAEWAAVIREFNDVEGPTPTIKQALCVPNEKEVGTNAKSWMGIPRQHVVAGNDLKNFPSAWRRCFPDPDREVRPHERDKFLTLYGGNSKPEKQREFIDHTEHLFRQQFTCSYTLLDTLADNRQLLVRGGAGTGKTWLAIEHACRLAEDESAGEDGREVLFLCYNKALAAHLDALFARRELGRGTVKVFAWEALADHLLERCEIDNQAPGDDAPPEDKVRYYEQDLPGIIVECVTNAELADRLPKFDALVVDEAQDHDSDWWPIYYQLLREGADARMGIYYDPEQRPPFRASDGFDIRAVAAPLSQPAYATLPKALRYTRPVYEYLQSLHSPGTEGLLSGMGNAENLPEGPEVERVRAKRPDTADEVEKLLKRWKEQGLCEPQDAILLHVRRDLADTALGPIQKLAGLPLVEATDVGADAPKRAIRHTTIHRAKGLDATAVILVGLWPFEDVDNASFQHTHFMGASRARQLLGIVEVAKA